MSYVLERQRAFFKENCHQFFTGRDIVGMLPSVIVCGEATIAQMNGVPDLKLVEEEMNWEPSE